MDPKEVEKGTKIQVWHSAKPELIEVLVTGPMIENDFEEFEIPYKYEENNKEHYACWNRKEQRWEEGEGEYFIGHPPMNFGLT